jgi:hypothetical protein
VVSLQSARAALATGRIAVGAAAFAPLAARALPKGDALTLAEIAGVMQQRPADVAAEEGRRTQRILQPAAAKPERHAGHLAAILQLDQAMAPPVEAAGDRIGQRQIGAEGLLNRLLGSGATGRRGLSGGDGREAVAGAGHGRVGEGRRHHARRLPVGTLRATEPAASPAAPHAPLQP